MSKKSSRKPGRPPKSERVGSSDGDLTSEPELTVTMTDGIRNVKDTLTEEEKKKMREEQKNLRVERREKEKQAILVRRWLMKVLLVSIVIHFAASVATYFGDGYFSGTFKYSAFSSPNVQDLPAAEGKLLCTWGFVRISPNGLTTFDITYGGRQLLPYNPDFAAEHSTRSTGNIGLTVTALHGIGFFCMALIVLGYYGWKWFHSQGYVLLGRTIAGAQGITMVGLFVGEAIAITPMQCSSDLFFYVTTGGTRLTTTFGTMSPSVSVIAPVVDLFVQFLIFAYIFKKYCFQKELAFTFATCWKRTCWLCLR